MHVEPVSQADESWRGPDRGEFLLLPPMRTLMQSLHPRSAMTVETPADFAVTRRATAVSEREMAHGVSPERLGTLRLRPMPAPVTVDATAPMTMRERTQATADASDMLSLIHI